MKDNQHTRYGAIAKSIPFNSGKVFFLVGTSEEIIGRLEQMFVADGDGTTRIYSTWATVITAVQNEEDDGAGCVIYVSPSFTTQPTAAQIASLEAAQCSVYQMGIKNEDGTYTAYRAAANLPQTTSQNIFQVNGKVELINILAEVTQAVSNTASLGNTGKFFLLPDVGTTTDLCVGVDVQGQPTGSIFSITGTLSANMVVTSTNGVLVRQASPLVVTAGKIKFNATAGCASGKVTYKVVYKPLEPGAFVSAL